MSTLRNKVAVITGSARGIGSAIAERYAKLGANIVVNYSRDRESAEKVVSHLKELNVKAIAVQADVARVEEVRRLFETAKASFGKIDIIVANAGVELPGVSVADFTEEQFDRLFTINTKGAYFTLQLGAKYVEDNGRIIYIGSSSAGYPMQGYALHGGSKVAPHYLVQVLAREVGKRGITVNSILPTATEGAGVHSQATKDSPIEKFMETFNPMGRMGTPEDVANVAEFFASDLSSYVSGQSLLVNGGALA
jgi:3-oxoacyl-[acyl-carrier protein] reductase